MTILFLLDFGRYFLMLPSSVLTSSHPSSSEPELSGTTAERTYNTVMDDLYRKLRGSVSSVTGHGTEGAGSIHG